jgi:hypothetical protein
MPFEESEGRVICPKCKDTVRKIPSVATLRFAEWFDNAIAGPEGMYGNYHGSHKEKEEESEEQMRKRQELLDKGGTALEDYIFDGGRPMEESDEF